MTRWFAAPLLTVALLAAGCSGDDQASDADVGETGCPAQGFTGEVRRLANGGHVDAAFGTTDVVTELVVAARVSEGAFYTLYVSDHDYLGDPRNFETVRAAPGGALATLSLGLQGGYVQGDRFTSDDDGATIAIIVDTGGGAGANTAGSTATVTPLGWDAGWVCFDLDYRDDFQSVVGTISAPVVAGF